MDLLPDEAQQEIIDQTAAFLDEAMPIDRFRTGGPERARFDDAGWRQVGELGWFGLGLPETRGGVGFTLVEEALVAREIGRRVGAVDLLASMLAAHVAEAADDASLRDQVVAGVVRVGWAERIDGVASKLQVFDGNATPLWLRIEPEGARLLDASRATVRSERLCLDEFTELLHVEVATDDVRVTAARADLFDHAAILGAAYLTGLAEAARDQAATYASERTQFGKPIGTFQAIKHACADMAVRAEASWAQTSFAALSLRDGLPDASFQVSAAKALAGESASANAAANLQVHGGYGFTTDYDAHLFVKRTHVLNALAGSPRVHLGSVVDAPAAA